MPTDYGTTKGGSAGCLKAFIILLFIFSTIVVGYYVIRMIVPSDPSEPTIVGKNDADTEKLKEEIKKKNERITIIYKKKKKKGIKPDNTPKKTKEVHEKIKKSLEIMQKKFPVQNDLCKQDDSGSNRIYLEQLYWHQLDFKLKNGKFKFTSQEEKNTLQKKITKRLYRNAKLISDPINESNLYQRGMKYNYKREHYSPSYSQYLCLLIYAYDGNVANWTESGKAAKLVKELAEVSKRWSSNSGSGHRYRIDGSIMQLVMYSFLTLYINNHWCKGKVGEALGIPVIKFNKSHSKKTGKEPFLIISKNICFKVEEWYRGKRPQPSPGCGYYGTSENITRIGSKIMYYMFKAVIKYEMKKGDWKADLNDAWKVIKVLEGNESTIPHTYSLVYIVRALTLLVRLDIHYAKGKIPNRVIQGIESANKMMDLMKSNTIKYSYTEYYKYLISMAYITELQQMLKYDFKGV